MKCDDHIGFLYRDLGEWSEEQRGERREIIERSEWGYGVVEPGGGMAEHHHQVVADRIQPPHCLENHHHPAGVEEYAADKKPNERETDNAPKTSQNGSSVKDLVLVSGLADSVICMTLG